MSRLLPWLIGAFIVFYLVTDPDGAAAFANHLGHGVEAIAHSLSDFVNKL